ncbi:exosome non-catalytic core subunit rrp46 [Gurleya vavrai]
MNDINCSLDALKNCNGSSSFNFNKTTVFCSVIGPTECPYKHENSSFPYLEIKWKETSSLHAKSTEKYFSSIIEQIITKFILPLDYLKMIQINFYVCENERNTLFCAVNACILALIQAGIPLKKMFYAGTSLSVKEEIFIFDSNEEVLFKHGFGECSKEMENEARKNALLVKKEIDFCIEQNLEVDLF